MKISQQQIFDSKSIREYFRCQVKIFISPINIHHHHHHIYLPYRITNFKDIYSMLLGSGIHQAYRRGPLDITLIKPDKGCEGVRQKLTQKLF